MVFRKAYLCVDDPFKRCVRVDKGTDERSQIRIGIILKMRKLMILVASIKLYIGVLTGIRPTTGVVPGLTLKRRWLTFSDQTIYNHKNAYYAVISSCSMPLTSTAVCLYFVAIAWEPRRPASSPAYLQKTRTTTLNQHRCSHHIISPS